MRKNTFYSFCLIFTLTFTSAVFAATTEENTLKRDCKFNAKEVKPLLSAVGCGLDLQEYEHFIQAIASNTKGGDLQNIQEIQLWIKREGSLSGVDFMTQCLSHLLLKVINSIEGQFEPQDERIIFHAVTDLLRIKIPDNKRLVPVLQKLGLYYCVNDHDNNISIKHFWNKVKFFRTIFEYSEEMIKKMKLPSINRSIEEYEKKFKKHQIVTHSGHKDGHSGVFGTTQDSQYFMISTSSNPDLLGNVLNPATWSVFPDNWADLVASDFNKLDDLSDCLPYVWRVLKPGGIYAAPTRYFFLHMDPKAVIETLKKSGMWSIAVKNKGDKALYTDLLQDIMKYDEIVLTKKVPNSYIKMFYSDSPVAQKELDQIKPPGWSWKNLYILQYKIPIKESKNILIMMAIDSVNLYYTINPKYRRLGRIYNEIEIDVNIEQELKEFGLKAVKRDMWKLAESIYAIPRKHFQKESRETFDKAKKEVDKDTERFDKALKEILRKKAPRLPSNAAGALTSRLTASGGAMPSSDSASSAGVIDRKDTEALMKTAAAVPTPTPSAAPSATGGAATAAEAQTKTAAAPGASGSATGGATASVKK